MSNTDLVFGSRSRPGKGGRMTSFEFELIGPFGGRANERKAHELAISSIGVKSLLLRRSSAVKAQAHRADEGQSSCCELGVSTPTGVLPQRAACPARRVFDESGWGRGSDVQTRTSRSPEMWLAEGAE